MTTNKLLTQAPNYHYKTADSCLIVREKILNLGKRGILALFLACLRGKPLLWSLYPDTLLLLREITFMETK